MIRLEITVDGESRLLSLAKDQVGIGRTPDNDVVLTDRKLSRHHCRILAAREGFWVQDLGSRNGTFVGDRRITEAAVQPGDRIRVGSSELRVLGEPTGQATEALDEVKDRLLEELENKPRQRRRRSATRKGLELENRQLRRLLEVCRDLARERSLNRLLFKIVDAALELTGAERGFLLLFEGEQPTFKVARHYLQTDIAHPEFEISHSIAERVSRAGRTVHARDALTEAGLKGMRSVVALELRSLLCVPLRANRQTLGAVYVDHRSETGAFTTAQVRLVEALAAQAAFAVGNASLRQDLGDVRRKLHLREAKLGKLESRLERRRERRRQTAASRAAEAPDTSGESISVDRRELIVRSSAMRDVIRLLERIAPTQAPVSIHGESGAGKEIVARLLHRLDGRGGTFVPLDCAALPETLMEAELFGHARGAFTGATESRPGLLQLADQGTILLDRADEMSPALQAKLLRVLEDGAVRRLGSHAKEPLRARIVTTTRAPLRKAVEAGELREDLFYRLAVFEVRVPPLRERSEDLAALWDEIARRELGADGPPTRLDRAAEQQLAGYDWPGNVRELENLIRQLSVLGERTVGKEDIQRALATRRDAPVRPLKEAVEEVECRSITAALRQTGGNKSQAAKLLGLSRPGLQNKLDRYGLE
ncbi:MAG: sigma 54-interacting transcriptional regulator [Planctomycetota bacterium]